jgi:diguanylate cyclase (GGDEF)-like protein
VQYQDGEGRTHWCQAAIARMGRGDGSEGGADLHRPSAPVPSGSAVVQLLDVTHQQQLQARLTHMAMHDQLTGLPNRNLLQDRVDHALSAATRSGALVALLFFDIDDFKTVNDSLGHPAGDRVLKALAERISAAVRPDDTVARIGGDEFVVCCAAVDSREHAFEIAQRVKVAAAEPIELEDRTIRVSVSGGITLSTPDSSVTDLLRESDSAMYEAKRAGGSHVTLFASALQRRAQRHLDVEHELRLAVERDQLVMHYQPIIDLVTESPVALEALIRWQHPERGLLLPGAWLDVAESSGLMHDIGAWALAETSRFGAVLADELSAPLTLHVNVSARQLLEPDFAAVVKDVLRHSGMAATRLVVELTETHLMSIGGKLVSELHELQLCGVRLAADDFGTGYSSLTQLTVLPIDELKIDKSFVLAMGQDTRALAVVHGILGMATAMGLDVVAEGVETRAAAETLRDLGCPHAQGFLWGAAGPPAEVLSGLRRSGALDAGTSTPGL